MMNLSDSTIPMQRIVQILESKIDEGMNYKELAELCNTTPKTISNWINKGCDLKWYSLLDICIGLNVPLSVILKDTRWEINMSTKFGE